MSVYFIRNTRTKAIKIGWSERPLVRMASLQTSVEDPLRLEAVVTTDDCEMEAQLHAAFAGERVRGEWFRGERIDRLVVALQRPTPVAALAYLRAEAGESLETADHAAISGAPLDDVAALAEEALWGP